MSLGKLTRNRLAIIVLIAVLINVATFCFAFSQALLPENGPYARDFSAYYIGGWRWLHNPTKIYQGGVVAGDYPIHPEVQTFKYTPNFLLLIAPFMTLSYQNAFIAFDLLQVALFPLMAYFVYMLLKDKNKVVAYVAAVLILISPLPTPPFNSGTLDLLHSRFMSLNPQSFSPTFFVGYWLGNAHLLQTFLLVGALYFGFSKKPWLSALLFAFACLDPRQALFALPLLLWYNRESLKSFVLGAAGFLALTNLPFFFYQNIGMAFLHEEFAGYIVVQMYPYDWLPFYAVATLMIVEVLSVGKAKKQSLLPSAMPKNMGL